VPVVIEDASIRASRSKSANLTAAMRAWEAATGVRIRLVRPGERSVLHVFDNPGSNACYATIGWRAAFIERGRILSGGDIFIGDCSRGSVLHEFGHALGLMHEHQRSDRDAYIDASAIAPVLAKCRTAGGGCREAIANFARSTRGERLRTDYDPCSIMHYLADQSGKARKGNLPPSGAWSAWYGLRPAGEANARRCRRLMTPIRDCAWSKTGQKCEISCKDAEVVARFHGLSPKTPCWRPLQPGPPLR
jgi:hypothetical protein